MATTSLVGSTGLVGSSILATITSLPAINKVYAYSRKDLSPDAKVTPLTSSDTSIWASLYPKDSSIFFSALGTTRANAGGLENQRKIEVDLNLALAKAAKEAGTKVYVLISSAGANSKSLVPYPRMKGEIEEGIRALGFEHTIVLRPGLIVGNRSESRPAEFGLRKLAGWMGAVNIGLQDFWAQDAQVIARAAVSAGLKCENGEETEKFRILTQADIVRLGRTEWKA